jgi:phosphatidylserine decarboxylase
VVTRVVPGQVLRPGERIGLMKFGSRMDVFVPPEAELLVAPKQKVVAGETLLARWPS